MLNSFRQLAKICFVAVVAMALLTGAWHYFDRTVQQKGQLQQFASTVHLSVLPLLKNNDRQLLQAQLNHMRYVSALPITAMAIYDQRHRAIAESDNATLLQSKQPNQPVTATLLQKVDGQWLLIQPLEHASVAGRATDSGAADAYLMVLTRQQLHYTEWLMPLLIVFLTGLMALKAIHSTLAQAASRQHTDISLLTHKLFQLRQGQQGIRIDDELVVELQPLRQALNEFAAQHEVNQQRLTAELKQAVMLSEQEREHNKQLQLHSSIAEQDYLRLQQAIALRLANLKQLLAQSAQMEQEQLLASLSSLLSLLYLEQADPAEQPEPVNCSALVDTVVAGLQPTLIAQRIDLQIIETGGLASNKLLLDETTFRSVLGAMLQLIARISAASDVVLRLQLNAEEQTSLQLSVSCNGNGISPRIIQLLNATDSKALQWHEADIGCIIAIRQKYGANLSIQSLEGLGYTLTLTLPVKAGETSGRPFQHLLLFDSGPLLTERSQSLSSVARYVVSCADIAELQRKRVLHRYDATLIFLPSPSEIPQWQPLLTADNLQSPVLLYARATEQPKWQLATKLSVSEYSFCLAHLADMNRLQHAPRLLVVDDNPTNLAFIQVLLQHQTVQLTTAASGNEALELCRQQVFDIILLDIQLPDISGTEVALQLRQQAAYQDIPILAFTAHALEQEVQSFKASGMNDVILKPLDAAKLEQIMYWCSKGKMDHT